MTGTASIAAVVLAAVFGWAAVAKAVRHRATVDAFRALGLPVPALLAIGVPALEGLLTVLLPTRPAVGAAFAVALLAAFTLVVIRGVLRGSSSGCACFGAQRMEPVGPADVVRNGLLAGLAALATGTRTLVRPGPVSVAVMTAVGLGGIGIQAWARRRLDSRSTSGSGSSTEGRSRRGTGATPASGSGPSRAGA